MATSSIFAHVKITDPTKAEMFVNALEASKNAQAEKPCASTIPVMRDVKDIRKLMEKRLSVS